MAPKTRVYVEGYAPPEQIVGKPEQRSDLFLLAATLYHLLTGNAPDGIKTGPMIDRLLADPKNPIPQQQRWFYELLRINLSEDPIDRYCSAREIKRDLENRRVAKQVLCPKCHIPNPVRQPYCGRCQNPLTPVSPFPCTQCGQAYPMCSIACMNCGHLLEH